MKSLVEYISEAKFNRNIEFYDLNIVSESLKDPKLIELAKYLKKFTSDSFEKSIRIVIIIILLGDFLVNLE